MNSIISKKATLIIFFLTMSIILIGTFIAIERVVFSNDTKRIALENGIGKTLECETILQYTLQDYGSKIQKTSLSESLLQYRKKEKKHIALEASFLNRLKESPELLSLSYIDAGGIQKIRVERKKIGEIPAVVASKTLKSDTVPYPYERTRNKRLKETWFSLTTVSGSGQTVLTTVVPFYEKDRLSGVLVATYDVTTLLGKLCEGPVYDIILADSRGNPIYHNGSQPLGHEGSIGALKEKWGARFDEVIQREFFHDEEIVSRKLMLNLDRNVYLILQVKNTYLDKERESTFHKYILIGMIVGLFSLLISWLLAGIIHKLVQSRMQLIEELKENQSLLKTTLDEQEAILEVQTTGFIHLKQNFFLWSNETFERMLGYSRGELQGKPALMVYETEESYQNYWNKAQNALREHGIFSDELKAVKKDGTPITFIASLTSMKNSPDESMGVIIDISIQKQTEKELQNALKSNKALLEIINRYVSYVKIDLTGAITEISHHLRGELGCDGEQKRVGSIFELIINSRQKLFLMDFLDKAQNISYTFDVEYRNFNEGTNWYRVSISPEYDPEENVSGYVAFHENLDKMILLKKRSETDQLTGLANRLKIDEVLSHEFNRAERSEKPLSIMIIDIDHFKEVNDRYGHQTGDIVLREFAKILKHNVRSTDLVGRWGGEEFLLVCPFTDKEGTLAMAQNLQKIIRSTNFSVVGHKTASFGISQFRTGETSDDMFKRVDDALYRAKTSGRDRIEVI